MPPLRETPPGYNMVMIGTRRGDMKGSIETVGLTPRALQVYAKICGAVLARAHARGGSPSLIAGYLGDDEAFTRWWPRWVELAAGAFGDDVHGWVPFAEIPLDAPAQPWRDTWGILAGVHPVVASLGPDDEAVGRYDGSLDALGLILPADWERDGTVGDRELDAAAERWGRRLRDAADAVDAPVVVSRFCPCHDDADTTGEIVGRLIGSLDDAIGDGVRLDLCFLEPGISAPDSPGGLLDGDRGRGSR